MFLFFKELDPEHSGKILGHMDSSVAAGIVAVSRVIFKTKKTKMCGKRTGEKSSLSQRMMEREQCNENWQIWGNKLIFGLSLTLFEFISNITVAIGYNSCRVYRHEMIL